MDGFKLSCMGSSCLLHRVTAQAAVLALQVDVFSFACIMYELFARTVMSTTVSPLSFNPEACERYAMKVSMRCSLRRKGPLRRCRAVRLCNPLEQQCSLHHVSAGALLCPGNPPWPIVL